jgi:hypothetical protein
MTWHHKGQEFTEDMIGDSYGFVYVIVNQTNNRKYIGKKFFSKAGYKTVKGKKKKVRKSSDWLTYYGSNKELQEDVKNLGAENFYREILYLCSSRSECSYRETNEIFKQDALLSENYYNSWVTCKIHKAHVLGKVN